MWTYTQLYLAAVTRNIFRINSDHKNFVAENLPVILLKSITYLQYAHTHFTIAGVRVARITKTLVGASLSEHTTVKS